MQLIPIKPFYHFTNRSNTLPHMSIRNAATVDNSVGSCAVYITPDNHGEITRCDNCQHSKSRIDPTAEYPGAIEASVLLLFSSGLKANLFEQIMCRMRGEDVNDILAECHYDDRLWGFAIRTAETWRTSNRHWGRGPMETSEYIVNTLKTLVQFTQPFTTRYILGTFKMLLCHLPNMLPLITFKMVAQNVPKIFPAYA